MNFFKFIFFATFLFLFTVSIYSQELTSNSSKQSNASAAIQDGDKVYLEKEVDIKAVYKSLAFHPKLFKGCKLGGSIKLQLLLHKSAKVTDVVFVEKNGCDNIHEAKIVASIRKLKFTPAIKDAIAVSQFLVKVF